MVVEEIAIAVIGFAVSFLVKRYCNIYQEVKEEWYGKHEGLHHSDSSTSPFSVEGSEISRTGTIKLKLSISDDRKLSETSQEGEDALNSHEGKWVWWEAAKRFFGCGEKKKDATSSDSDSLASLFTNDEVFKEEDQDVNAIGDAQDTGTTEAAPAA